MNFCFFIDYSIMHRMSHELFVCRLQHYAEDRSHELFVCRLQKKHAQDRCHEMLAGRAQNVSLRRNFMLEYLDRVRLLRRRGNVEDY
jgi:hypothetical protein